MLTVLCLVNLIFIHLYQSKNIHSSCSTNRGDSSEKDIDSENMQANDFIILVCSTVILSDLNFL